MRIRSLSALADVPARAGGEARADARIHRLEVEQDQEVRDAERDVERRRRADLGAELEVAREERRQGAGALPLGDGLRERARGLRRDEEPLALLPAGDDPPPHALDLGGVERGERAAAEEVALLIP